MSPWQTMLMCGAFYVTGFLSCALLVTVLRDRVLDRHVRKCENDIYAPFLATQSPERGRHARPTEAPPGPPPGIRLDAFTDPPRRHRSE